jgi:hypothetical protein
MHRVEAPQLRHTFSESTASNQNRNRLPHWNTVACGRESVGI